MKEADKPDDIASSSTDDMFAFSQIIAQGEKVSKVTKILDDSAKAEQPKQDDEDQAILAFSDSLPGNDGAPVVVPVDKEAIAR